MEFCWIFCGELGPGSHEFAHPPPTFGRILRRGSEDDLARKVFQEGDAAACCLLMAVHIYRSNVAIVIEKSTSTVLF